MAILSECEDVASQEKLADIDHTAVSGCIMLTDGCLLTLSDGPGTP